MISAAPSSTVHLDRAAFTLLSSMPLVMVIANRSAAAIIILAALCALAARLVERRHGVPHRVKVEWHNPFLRAWGLSAAAFVVWCLLSIGWSHVPARSFFVFGEATAPFAAGLILLATMPRSIPAWFIRVAACLFALACLLMIVELETGLALRQQLDLRAQSFIFNRPVMTLLLVFWPLAIQLKRVGLKWWAIALGALLIVTIERATSGAAMLGLLLAVPAFVVASLNRRIGLALAGLALATCLAMAPFKGVLLQWAMPDKLIERLESVHAADRLAIWQDFAAIVQLRPLTGAGFGTSAKMAEAPFAKDVPPERGSLLAVGHPHDGFLQIWSELGLAGALLAAVNGVFLLRALARLPADMAPAGIAVTIAAAAMVSVFHSAWQGWWVGLLMALPLWCAFKPDITGTRAAP